MARYETRSVAVAVIATVSWVVGLEWKKCVQTECAIGTFHCNSSNLCVQQQQNCDGNSDCPDGSDEWNCTDEHERNFWDSMFLKRPAADLDEEEDECRLQLNETSCICLGTSLTCEYQGWRRVPGNLPPETTLLDLSGNFFPVFSVPSDIYLPSLETLVLKHVDIKEIDEAAFSGFWALKSLHVTNNHFQSISSRVFSNNTQLEDLNLSYNKIKFLSPQVFERLTALKELDLRKNLLEKISWNVLKPLVSLEKLYLIGNRLVTIRIGTFPPLFRLKLLSLTHNSIATIEPGAFQNLTNLQVLFLSNNKLTVLQGNTFTNLTKLLQLNLDENILGDIHNEAFASLGSLESLNLEQNIFKKLNPHVLEDLECLKHVYFDVFSLCSAALHVRDCRPKGDGISSIDHLLDNFVLRASVWIMAFTACVGNVFVLVGRFLVKESNVVHSFYIKNLAFSDLLLGIYLFLIAAYDLHYRGVYIHYEHRWRNSWQCNFCGFLSTLSSESSVFILTIITYDRFVSITQPLARKETTLRKASIIMAVLWLISITVALMPLSGLRYYGTEFYGSNGVCLPLHIHDAFAKGWEYSAAMFMVVTAIALGFIGFAYLKMLSVIRESRLSLRSTQERQDRVVAQRFAVIVGTDCLCWVPVILIKILVLAGLHIQKDLYAWLAVFVLPINSALNPVLYTLTTKLFKQQISRLLYTCKRKDEHAHSGDNSNFSLSFGASGKRGILTHQDTHSTSVRSSMASRGSLKWTFSNGIHGTSI